MTTDYAPVLPGGSGPGRRSDAAASESQAELQSRGVPTDGNADAAGNSPEAPARSTTT